MNTQTYYNGNFLQKQVREVYEIFRPHKFKQIILPTYQPSFSKIRLALSGLFIAGCIGTPATNGLIPIAIKWGLK